MDVSQLLCHPSLEQSLDFGTISLTELGVGLGFKLIILNEMIKSWIIALNTKESFQKRL